MGCEIARALEAAHAQRILHGVLKPSNVKVTPDGRIKILDFGLSRAIGRTDPPVATGTPTQEEPILGTPGYISPDRIRGGRPDAGADIFAFGCILYECLTGKQAFGGFSPNDRLRATLLGRPDWNALPDATPPAVKQLLLSCLAPRDRGRLASMSEAVCDLERSRAVALSRAEPVIARIHDQRRSRHLGNPVVRAPRLPHLQLVPPSVTRTARDRVRSRLRQPRRRDTLRPRSAHGNALVER